MQKMYENILLVEDDEDDRAIFFHALNQMNISISCRWAQNGADALDILYDNSNNLPGCIFMDYNMPKLNGLECLNLIKQNETLKHIPVIILSTASDTETQRIMKAAGAIACIKKPDNIKNLVNILNTYLVIQNAKMLA